MAVLVLSKFVAIRRRAITGGYQFRPEPGMCGAAAIGPTRALGIVHTRASCVLCASGSGLAPRVGPA
jgi:hypothetical protein